MLLQTSKPECSIEVRVLFNSESQQSYMTTRAMQQLQLKQEGKRNLSIAAFGADHEKIQVCPLVNIGIRSREHYTILLTLHVVPTICEPLSYQPVTASVEVNSHLVGLDLADFSESSSCLSVDLLVGCDHYWDLVMGSICRGEKGPTAIHTKLGWVLSGPPVPCCVLQLV